AVEAHVRSLAGRDGTNEIGRRGMLWQRKEARPLLHESVANEALVGIGGHEPRALHPLDPRVELGVEIVERAKRTSGEEGFAEIANASLDAALLVAARDCARLGREVVVAGEIEDARVKPD